MFIHSLTLQSLLWSTIPLISGQVDEFPIIHDNQRVSYENFTLFRVWSKESPLLIEDGFHGGSIFAHPDQRMNSYDILIPPGNRDNFLLDIKSRNWSFSTINSNVQEAIDEESTQIGRRSTETVHYNWEQYHSYEETNAWMKELAAAHPEVTLFDIGKSYKNRDTFGLKLSKGSDRAAVFLETGVHSREWIGISTATFIFHQLLTSEDPEVKRLSLEYDWFMVPMVNPDGYVRTRKDRLWRKNMRWSVLCNGVDLNRNWNYHWMEAGSSFFRCSDSFAGPYSMSEPETKNLEKFMQTISAKVKLYISFHSYGEILLWPEGHTIKRIPEYNDYERIGKATVDAIAKRYGTKYTRGSVSEAIYPAAGSTMDYMRGKLKIPLSFCFELRPERSNSGAGFILDPKQIIPTGEETLDGVVAMVKESESLGYFKL